MNYAQPMGVTAAQQTAQQTVPTAAQLTAQVPLAQIERFLMESLPAATVAHSYHVDALVDPRAQRDPVFQRFSQVELNELHHQIAAVGALLRLQRGDTSALRSLGLNLAGFIQNRQAALSMAPQLRPEVTQLPAVQALMQMVQFSNQQLSTSWPVLSQALMMTQAPAPGPMLVDPQRI